MTGLSINVTTIILTVAFALFAFVFAFLISSLVSKDKIASDKRLEELKKNEGDSENYSLAKHESRMKKRNREKKKQGGFFEKFGSALYHLAFGNCCSGVAYCFVFAKLRYCACGFNCLPFSSYAFNQNEAKEKG